MTRNARKRTGARPVNFAKAVAARGAGEILLTSMDRDGTGQGYDLELTRSVADSVDVPVIASGGAGSLADIGAVVSDGRASAAAIGSMAVFQAKGLGVLIKFPGESQLRSVVG